MTRSLAAIGIWLSLSAIAWADTYVYVAEAGEKRIAVYKMNPQDGKLTRQSEVATLDEPGALTVDPQCHFLFASLRPAGKLSAFRIDSKTGGLTHLNTVDAGPDPAHLSTDKEGRFLLAAYYVAAQVTVHGIGKDGALSDKPLQTIKTADKAHAILLDEANRFALVPHTGPNQIFQFAFEPKTGQLKPAETPFVKTPKGTGPRHVVFHPTMKDLAYVANEQGGSVTAYRLDQAGNLKAQQTLSTLPEGYKGANACAEIRIHPLGKLLYVSNRGHDSIAAFRINPNDGLLTPLGQTPTEKTPRSFDLDPSGKYLFAAGESSWKLAAYQIGAEGLQRIATYDVGRRPWWVLAVEVK